MDWALVIIFYTFGNQAVPVVLPHPYGYEKICERDAKIIREKREFSKSTVRDAFCVPHDYAGRPSL